MLAVIILSIAGGALLASAAAKAASAWRGRLVWPDPSLAGVPIPAGAVAAGEAVVAFSLIFSTPRISAIALAACYALLSIAAWHLRGQICGCFGAALSAVGPGHIAGTIVACLGCIAFAAAGPGTWVLSGPWRAGVLLAAAAVVSGAVAIYARHKRRGEELLWDPSQYGAAAQMLILTRSDCPHCAALRQLFNGVIGDRWLRWQDEAQAPATLRTKCGNAVPCGFVIDAGGKSLAGPVMSSAEISQLAEVMLAGASNDRSDG